MTNHRTAFVFAFFAAAALLSGFASHSFAQNIRAQGYGQIVAGPKAAAPDNEPNRAPDAPVAAGRSALSDLERTAFALVNRQRAALKLAPLAWSDAAAAAAREHSQEMVDFGYFGHSGRDGSTVGDRAASSGLDKWLAIGENIAFNRGFSDPVATAVEKWMLSPGHRDNILDAGYNESGIGIAVKSDGSYYFTQVFLKR